MYKMRKEIKKPVAKTKHLEILMDCLDLFKAAAPLGMLGGIFVVLAYCSFNSFVPDIQLENALVFVFSILGLALTLLMGFFFSVALMLPVVWVCFQLFSLIKVVPWVKNKYFRNPQRWSLDENLFNLPMLCGCSVGLLFLLLLFATAKDNSIYYYQLPQTLMGFVPPGFFIILMLGIKSKASNKIISVEFVIATVIVFFVSVFLIGRGSGVIQLAMQLIGISQHHVDVVVNEKTKQDIKERSVLYGISPKICKVGDGKTYLISDVDLIWHGIGAKTWLSIKQRDQKHNIDAELNIPVNADEISVLHKTIGISHKNAVFDFSTCKSPD